MIQLWYQIKHQAKTIALLYQSLQVASYFFQIFILDNIIKLLTEPEPDSTLNDEALECFLKNQSEYYNRQKNNESFKSDYHEYIGDVSIFTDSSSFDLKQHLVSNPGSDPGRELDVLNLDILDLYD